MERERGRKGGMMGEGWKSWREMKGGRQTEEEQGRHEEVAGGREGGKETEGERVRERVRRRRD